MVFNFENDGNARSAPLSTTLLDLATGESARIEGVCAAGTVGQRLRELGFLPGTEVRMVRRAPLGDPILFELRGAQICLRKGEARTIQVRRPAP